MMKKYNKPEIVTLALDMVDVIETSAEELAAAELATQLGSNAKITTIEKQVTEMNDNWSW
ncbi:MAG: hypothetical protein E7406_00110 [Ruminococcaceae bacterium]|nr:hypothetical protein [Oscillospiraceae bacterium]